MEPTGGSLLGTEGALLKEAVRPQSTVLLSPFPLSPLPSFPFLSLSSILLFLPPLLPLTPLSADSSLDASQKPHILIRGFRTDLLEERGGAWGPGLEVSLPGTLDIYSASWVS